MSAIAEKLDGIYRNVEDWVYAALDWLDDHGVPAYAAHDWLEDHGIPPVPTILATILLLLGGTAFLLFGTAPTYTAMITVTDGQTGQPIAGAQVALLSGNAIIATGTTDSSGVAVLSGIKQGNYRVRVVADNYKMVESTISVASNMSSKSISLKPLHSNEFCVRVLDPSGNVVTNAEVQVDGTYADFDGDTMAYCTTVGSDSVSLYISTPDGLEFSKTVKTSEGTKDHPYVAKLVENTAAAKAETHKVSVTVTDPQGNPMSGVAVRLYSADGTRVVSQSITDQDGIAVLDGVPAGQYILVADDTKHHLAYKKPISVTDNSDITVPMSPAQGAFSYSGNVYVPPTVGQSEQNGPVTSGNQTTYTGPQVVGGQPAEQNGTVSPDETTYTGPQVGQQPTEENGPITVTNEGELASEETNKPVKITLLDSKTHSGVKDVTITITGISTAFTTNITTNENGVAEANVPAGDYNIIVAAPEGYISFSRRDHVGDNGLFLTLYLHHKYEPGIQLLGIKYNDNYVGTLPAGKKVNLVFSVAVPYNAKTAKLKVKLGEDWQDDNEVKQLGAINNGREYSVDLSSKKEQVVTVDVPLNVGGAVGEKLKISWEYDYLGEDGTEKKITGAVRPVITNDVLRCGYGWAVAYTVTGPTDKDGHLYAGDTYQVNVEYAKCDSDAKQGQIAVLVDDKQVGTAGIDVNDRYGYGKTSVPISFRPSEAGKKKLDVRIVSGEDVLARKYGFITVLSTVMPAYRVTIKAPESDSLLYAGTEETVWVRYMVHDRNVAKVVLVAQYTKDGVPQAVNREFKVEEYDVNKDASISFKPVDTGTATVQVLLKNADGDTVYQMKKDFQVVKEKKNVTIKVTDSKGNTIPGASVKLVGDSGVVAQGSTNGDGEVTFNNVETGEYNVVVSKDGYLERTEEVTIRPGQTPPEQTVKLYKNIEPAVELTGIKSGTDYVGTLPAGKKVNLVFSVAVPYNAKTAKLKVKLGEDWQDDNEVKQLGAINNGREYSVDLSSKKEQVVTVDVPLNVGGAVGEKLKISWEYDYLGEDGTEKKITGAVRPVITNDVLRCGYGWAVAYTVTGPTDKDGHLYAGDTYQVNVEYAKCDSDAKQGQIAVLVDDKQVGTAGIDVNDRYGYGKTSVPISFRPSEAGKKKLDVRIVSGEDVLARKYGFITVLSTVMPAYRVTITNESGEGNQFTADLDANIGALVFVHDRNVARIVLDVKYNGGEKKSSVSVTEYDQNYGLNVGFKPGPGTVTATVTLYNKDGDSVYEVSKSFQSVRNPATLVLSFKDNQGNPVPHVRVTVNGPKSASGESNADGVVELNLVSGAYTLRFNVPSGYLAERSEMGVVIPAGVDRKDVSITLYKEVQGGVQFLGFYREETPVGTLPAGGTVKAKWRVAVPNGARNAKLRVWVDVSWSGSTTETRKYIEISDGKNDVEKSFSIGSDEEGNVVTESVTLKVEGNAGVPVRIHWSYSYTDRQGDPHEVNGMVEPTITKGAITCYNGWGLDFNVTGPRGNKGVLLPKDNYTIHVMYVPCAEHPPSGQIKILMDGQQIGSAGTRNDGWYRLATADIPVTFPERFEERYINLEARIEGSEIYARVVKPYTVAAKAVAPYVARIYVQPTVPAVEKKGISDVVYRSVEYNVCAQVRVHDPKVHIASMFVRYTNSKGAQSGSSTITFPPNPHDKDVNMPCVKITATSGTVSVSLQFKDYDGRVLHSTQKSFPVTDYNASLTVTVEDSHGKGVKDVIVSVTNLAHSYTATTDGDGNATLNVALGDYEVSLVPPPEYLLPDVKKVYVDWKGNTMTFVLDKNVAAVANLINMTANGHEVASLARGTLTDVLFHVGVPAGVEGEFQVKIGDSWQTESEINAVAVIKSLSMDDTSCNISSDKLSASCSGLDGEQTYDITLELNVMPNAPTDMPLKISWELDLNDGRKIAKYERISVSKDVLRCGDGWAVAAEFNGPKYGEKYFPGEQDQLTVYYAKCKDNAPYASVYVLLNGKQAGSASASAQSRYRVQTQRFPITLDQPSKTYIMDVRVGRDYNVYARSLLTAETLGTGRKVCIKLKVEPPVPVQGQEMKVIGYLTDCKGNRINDDNAGKDVNLIVSAAHVKLTNEPPFPITYNASTHEYEWKDAPESYGDILFTCKGKAYDCVEVKPSVIWVFSNGGIGLDGPNILWLPQNANKNGIKGVNIGYFRLYNYTIYPITVDSVNVECNTDKVEAGVQNPGSVAVGTYTRFPVTVAGTESAECNVVATAHYRRPDGTVRYMMARKEFNVSTATGRINVTVNPAKLNVFAKSSATATVTVSSDMSVQGVRISTSTLDPNVSVSVQPASADVAPGMPAKFYVTVTPEGSARTVTINLTAKGKAGMYDVSKDASLTVNVLNPNVLSVNINKTSTSGYLVENKANSATIDFGKDSEAELNVILTNGGSKEVVVYVGTPQGGEHVMATTNHVSSPITLKQNGKSWFLVKLSTKTYQPFQTEQIKVPLRVYTHGGKVYGAEISSLDVTIKAFRHERTCLELKENYLGKEVTVGRPVAISIINNCGADLNAKVVVFPAGNVRLQGTTSDWNVLVPTDGNAFTVIPKAEGTYSIGIKGLGRFSDVLSNSVSITAVKKAAKASEKHVVSCNGGSGEDVKLYAVYDEPFENGKDCQVAYCGEAELTDYLAKQVERLLDKAGEAKIHEEGSDKWENVTSQIPGTTLKVLVKQLPSQLSWYDVADVVYKDGGVRLAVGTDTNPKDFTGTGLEYNGTVQNIGTYELEFNVYKNVDDPKQVYLVVNATYVGNSVPEGNGFYLPLYVNLGEYGQGGATTESATTTYYQEGDALQEMVEEELLPAAFPGKYYKPKPYSQMTNEKNYLFIGTSDCDGLAIARVTRDHYELNVCKQTIDQITKELGKSSGDITQTPTFQKLKEAVYHFFAMDGQVLGCVDDKGNFIIKGVRASGSTSVVAMNDVFVMPYLHAERVLTFNLPPLDVKREFNITHVAIEGLPKDGKLVIKSADANFAEGNVFSVNPDGQTTVSIELNADVQDTVTMVLTLKEVPLGFKYLGVIRIHPVGVKESDFIKIATAPGYELPGDKHYPLQLIDRLFSAGAVKPLDGYSDGYNPGEIKADILGPKGERADYYNAQLELSLPIYLVHDVQSCVDLQMNIWGKMKDADYPDYVVEANLSTADGKECELPDVGVYSTKHIAEQIGSKAGIAAFSGTCFLTTAACDLATGSFAGGAGIVAAIGDAAGCLIPPVMAGKFLGGTVAGMSSSLGNVSGLPVSALGGSVALHALTSSRVAAQQRPIAKFLPLRTELLERAAAAGKSAEELSAKLPKALTAIEGAKGIPTNPKAILESPDAEKAITALSVDDIASALPEKAVESVITSRPGIAAEKIPKSTLELAIIDAIKNGGADKDIASMLASTGKMRELRTPKAYAMVLSDPRTVRDMFMHRVNLSPFKDPSALYKAIREAKSVEGGGVDAATEFAKGLLKTLQKSGTQVATSTATIDQLLGAGALEVKYNKDTSILWIYSKTGEVGFVVEQEDLPEITGAGVLEALKRNPDLVWSHLPPDAKQVIERRITDRAVVTAYADKEPKTLVKIVESAEPPDELVKDPTIAKELAATDDAKKAAAEVVKTDPKILTELPDEDLKKVVESLAEKSKGIARLRSEDEITRALIQSGVFSEDQKDEARELAKKLVRADSEDAKRRILAETLIDRTHVGDGLFDMINEMGKMVESGGMSKEQFLKKLKEMGIENPQKYGIQIGTEGEKTVVKIESKTLKKQLAIDLATGKVPEVIQNPGTLRSVINSIISKWGWLDAKYMQAAEHSLTGKYIRKRFYKWGQQHQIAAGLFCAAAGQTAGTLAEWAHVDQTPDKYIDVKGKISDGLTVEVKAGANTWYVGIGQEPKVNSAGEETSVAEEMKYTKVVGH